MKKEKRYFIRKFVSAGSVSEALRKEKNAPVDGVWVEESKEEAHNTVAMGFSIPNDDGEY